MTFRVPPAPHVSREAEWLSAAILMAFALALLAPGATFSRPVFVNLAAVAPEGTWGMGLLGIATVRMIGLWVNGNWRRSPTLRFLISAVGALVWLWVARLFSDDGYPGLNTGALVYLAVGLFDLYAAGRSLADQGKNDRRYALARKEAA
ncbi:MULTISPECIES: hypothetical protein [Methylobacterium]|uniref:Uncharacterized protein n=1 Tax=Methylobacterium radiotolerans (strain ATCC 27329 / DSM 1819 / JCM 2831 / NBRC 15690 / NCIMB 10815 / 0-1) TaxID=426355 RepID=B1M173_METRJ|nr:MULTISPECIES: hypothetical protein [Methylobacterium]ACB24623.1 hypothetical protein Mrad2831_2639 [Methylobacterium radiotolerans JCM 2831]MBE7249548.1 hypothetical protein [Actinomycetospora chiangmaiensis]GEM97105.1 hypothetical protein MRA01_16450 [Methylobacterium radiotolerans]